eukprot:gene11877-6374_t
MVAPGSAAQAGTAAPVAVPLCLPKIKGGEGTVK